jgi:flagellar biosynthesis protein FliR
VLDQLLAAELFTPFLVFMRIGSAFTMLPGFAEAYVAMRYRLLLAAAISFAVTPVVSSGLPQMPATVPELAILLLTEIGIGLFLGMAARLAISALQVAGSIVAMQIGLSSVLVFDPSSQQQGAITGAWLAGVAMTLIFVTDSHHLMLRALTDSYGVFHAGEIPPIGDFSEAMTRLVADSFTLGVKISAPFLVFGFVFFLALGLIQRLMPQIQVFFVTQPLQIMFGMLILALTLSVGMGAFLEDFQDTLGRFIAFT